MQPIWNITDAFRPPNGNKAEHINNLSSAAVVVVIVVVVLRPYRATVLLLIYVSLTSFVFSLRKEGTKEGFYLTTHPTHFINGYMASDIW